MKNHKIEISPDLEGVVGATAAWVYQKWAANVLESVFRVFGGDLDPIFRENHQIFRSQHLEAKLCQKFCSLFLGRGPNFRLIDLQEEKLESVRYFSKS